MKYISRILMLLAVVLLSACAEDYLDTFPTDQLGADQVLSTIENQRAALEGMHRHMYSNAVGGSQGNRAGYGSMMINYDFLGHDVVNPQRGSGWFISAYQWIDHRNSSGALVSFTYDYFYTMIVNANNVINSIDAVEGDDAEKANIKGQALFYRAFGHYNLVQVFGRRYVPGQNNTQPGVVINLDDLNNIGEAKPRSTVEEVYAQIQTDLTAALQNITASGLTFSDKSQISANIVNGLLARVALTKGEWANAITYAQAARNGFNLTNMADITNGFNNDDTSGWIWSSHVIPDQGEYFASFFAYMSYNYNSTHIRNDPKCINADLYDLIPSTDVRKGFFAVTPEERAAIAIPSNFAKYAYMNTKFEALPSGTIGDGDVVLMRVAEMILIEAEANAHLGNDPAARTALLELTSERDTNAALSTNSGQALLDEILVQRRIELWGEGFNFLDLKRLNLPLFRPQRGSFSLTQARITEMAAGTPEWQFLLPISAINVNKLLEQNP